MKRIALVTGAAVLAITMVTFLSFGDDAPPVSDRAAAANPELEHGRVAVPRAIDAPEGSYKRYATSLQVLALLDGQEASASRLDFSLRGTTRVTRIDDESAAMLFEIRIEDPEVELSAAEPSAREAITQAVGRPFLARFSSQGSLQGIETEADTDPTTWRLWMQLASSLQVSAGEGAEYLKTEIDASGAYTAEYRALGDGRFERRKLGYVRVRTGQVWSKHDAGTLGIDGVTAIELDSDGLPHSVDGSETVWTEDSRALVDLRVETRIELHLAGRGEDPEATDRVARMRGSLRRSDFAPDGEAATAAETPERFADLAPLLADPDRNPALLLPRLSSSFRSDPDSIGAAMSALQADPSYDPTGAITAALADAGTAEAQAALGTLAAGEHDRRAVDALLELGRVASPNDDSIDALTRAADDPRGERSSTALLALGNAADSLQSQRRMSSDAIVADLASRLAGADSEAELQTLLLALGNTARAAAYEPISAHASDSRPAVRAAVADALRLVPGSDAGELLASLLASDPHQGVRARAAAAHASRGLETALPPLELALRSDPSPQVRSEAVSVLGETFAASDEVRALLSFVAANDDDERVRARATEML